MRVALQVRVTGLVQGVFFRAWTAEQARSLEVSGWVRNASDGSVEGHLEGDKNAVHELVGLLRTGPPSARVEAVDVEVTRPEGGAGFDIRN